MKNEIMTTSANNSIEKISFTEEQVQLIKQQIAPKATDAELKLFLYQAKRSGLDPLSRQIYAIHRWQDGGEKMTIQTSIDGFRIVAERSGVYAGQSEPEFIVNDGNLIAAKVRVFKFRGDMRYEAAVGVAYFNEYKQVKKDGSLMGMWAKMPYTMLAKCAEALALRKAFPQDLSGLYTDVEMEQSTEDVTPTVVSNGKPELKAGTKKYNDTVEKLRNCTVTLDTVKQYFTLSPEVEEVLLTIERTAQTPVEQEPA